MDQSTEARRLVAHAMALRDANRTAEGLELIDRALQLQPSDPTALLQRGQFLQGLMRLDEALASFDEAIRCKPAYAAALGAKAQLLMALRRLDDARAALDAAIRAKPHFAKTRYLKGELLLMAGEFAQGWELFEARLESGTHDHHPATAEVPRWRGEPLEGRRLLVHQEFGLGDVLMMARYFTYLEEAGAQLVLAVQEGLAGLLRASFPHAIVPGPRDPAPPVDLHCPVMSLPYALRARVAHIPARIPYLRPTPEAVARWRAELGEASAPRVGIVWRGAGRAIDRSALRNRSMPLATLEPLLRLPFEFHSLQQDVSKAAEATAIRQHGPRLRNFLETAALASSMDAVVSIDTSVAHLAGGLALPLHVMLPYACDYRWQGEGRTPWYPQALTFRQQAPGDWDGVVEETATSLAARFGIPRNS